MWIKSYYYTLIKASLKAWSSFLRFRQIYLHCVRPNELCISRYLPWVHDKVPSLSILLPIVIETTTLAIPLQKEYRLITWWILFKLIQPLKQMQYLKVDNWVQVKTKKSTWNEWKATFSLYKTWTFMIKTKTKWVHKDAHFAIQSFVKQLVNSMK